MTGTINILKQADIFYKLTPTQLEMISKLCEEKTFQAGEVIFFEGTTSDDLYILFQGEVDIQVNPALVSDQPADDFHPITIATFRRGQSFGEIALVDEGLRSARALCTQDHTHLIIVPRDRLMLLCGTYPDLGYRLMRNLAADLAMKIRNTDMQIREYIIWSRTS